jgi:murein DD-endopeptidase MepM/ murein hydrolase activator NlpD
MYFDEVIESTYHIENNNSSGQIDLFLEHALTNVWNGVENKTYELWESSASDANGPVPVRVLYRSSNFQCFTMFVKSGTKATFVVKEKVEVMRSEKLSAALTRDASLVSFWVKHNLIDSTTERNLKNVLALIASIAEDEARIYQLKKEKDEYSHQLEQARSNLNALKGKSSEEDTSRKKFTKRMNEFDDKLTENVHVSNQLKEQKDTKGRELRKLLNGIEYNNNQEAMQE